MAKGDTLGEFEQLVLMALIHLDDRAYGAAVQRVLAGQADRNVAAGAVYTTLHRLENKGYVSSRQGKPTAARGGRAKRLFKIDAPGRWALYQSLRAIERMRETLPLGWAMGE
jgi:PadR family transcriptional regulator PadR